MERLGRLVAVFIFGLLTLGMDRPAVAQRPSAPNLLPEKTLAYFRVTDAQLLVERFRETAMGRIVQDEQVRPLVSGLYSSAQNAFKQIEDRVGLPLDQLLRIPQGEISVAFVAPPERAPGAIFLIDVKSQLPQFERLLERGEDFLQENGGTKASEKIAGENVDVYSGQGGNSVFMHIREGTVLVTTSKELMESTLKAWSGDSKDKALADNDRFNSIMSRCAGSVDDPPQISFFVDPIELVRTLARGNFAATGLALIPVLGLDGIQGVGGSMTFATGEFDDVSHLHILLDNPRAGVLQLLAMKSGDTTPEGWIPPDVITYNTLNWDFQLTFDKGAKLYNSLVGENELQKEFERASERIGIDLEKDLLPALEGRVTFAQWVEKPVRINSITSLIGVKLKDPAAFQGRFQKLLDKHSERVEKKFYGGTTYWAVRLPEGARQRGPFGNAPPDGEENPEGPALRQPDPCVALVGDYVLMSDSSKALQAAIDAQHNPSRRLADELDFKLIASKIKRQVGGDAPGLIQFSRPEEGLRFWYEMAAAENTKRMLSRGAEENPFLKDVDQALKDNPLPPFSVLAKYLAPGGAMMVSDETGIHMLSFTLRRQMPD
jgi:hypothetical protein